MTVTDTDMTITVLWSPVVSAVEHTVADETSSFTLSFRACNGLLTLCHSERGGPALNTEWSI